MLVQDRKSCNNFYSDKYIASDSNSWVWNITHWRNVIHWKKKCFSSKWSSGQQLKIISPPAKKPKKLQTLQTHTNLPSAPCSSLPQNLPTTWTCCCFGPTNRWDQTLWDGRRGTWGTQQWSLAPTAGTGWCTSWTHWEILITWTVYSMLDYVYKLIPGHSINNELSVPQLIFLIL